MPKRIIALSPKKKLKSPKKTQKRLAIKAEMLAAKAAKRSGK